MADGGSIIIQGLGDNVKVPQFYGETKFGQSAIRFGSVPLKILVVGLESTAGGTIVPDTEYKRVFSKEDADTYTGAGGEAAIMCYAALDELRGQSGWELYVACPTGAGGASATTIATVTGTASANGTIYVYVCGERYEVTILSGDTQNTIAGKIDTALDAYPRYAATAGVATNAVTFTAKQAGIRGNDAILYVDFTNAPGVSVALSGTGGAAVTSSSTVVGRKFGGGTGTETLTTLLATLYPTWFEFIAIAQNDSTSLAAWEAQVDAKAGPIEGRMEHVVVASSGNLGAATSLAQTTLNNHRFCLPHLEISETPPSAVAAAIAGLRCATEQTTPNSAYDDYALKTVKPQRFPADWVTSHAEKQAALDVGVSPLETRADGKVYIVRLITTRCLDGAAADYRTLDTSEAYVPDYMRRRIGTFWTSKFKVANPHVRPDLSPGERVSLEKKATPSKWIIELKQILSQAENENIITQVVLNPPSADYNYNANRIMSIAPVIPLPHQHSIGVSVRQLNVA